MRSLTAALRSAMLAEQTGVVPLALLTITHPSLAAPIRLVNDATSATGGTNLTRGGEEYVAYPFDLVLPSDTDDGPPRARLTVDNVAREIVGFLRSASTAPKATIEIINAAAPDEGGATFGPYDFGVVEYGDLEVTTDLVLKDMSLEAWPALRYDASHFPGLFRQLA